MKKTPKKAAAAKWDTHVYLDEKTRKAVEAVAGRERRTMTKQIEVFIHQALDLARST